MTTALPLVASTFNGYGPYWAAWSPIHSGPDDNIVWLSQPLLPNMRFYRWATDAEVAREHITLTRAAIAELLFLAGVEPTELNVVSAAAAIDRVLETRGCDLNARAADAAKELYDNLGSCGRWNRCWTVTARLLKVEA